MNSDKLQAIRKQIDDIDLRLLKLLGERAQYALSAKKFKSAGDNIYKPSREAQIIKTIKIANKTKLSQDALEKIFIEVIGACRNLQSQLRIGYLGPEGTFSQQAAVKMFGSSSKFKPEASLHHVLRAVETDSTDVGILPIENSTEGSVAETHKLLLTSSLRISGEYTQPITQNLLSKANELSKITVVYAHPQSIGQCRQWLQTNLSHANVIPVASNAEAASKASKDILSSAIAGELASKIYSLPILQRSINDYANNRTRFISVSKIKSELSGDDKTSVVCSAKDKPGALFEILKVFNKHKVSMTRLESQPNQDHTYIFYIDFLGHENDKNISSLLTKLESVAKTCKVLGSYPRGND